MNETHSDAKRDDPPRPTLPLPTSTLDKRTVPLNVQRERLDGTAALDEYTQRLEPADPLPGTAPLDDAEAPGAEAPNDDKASADETPADGYSLITPSLIDDDSVLPYLDGSSLPDHLRTIVFDRSEGGRALVGIGGSADVFAGRAGNGERVAVKMFRADADSPSTVASVEKEWRAAQTDYGRHVVRALACYRVVPTEQPPFWALIMNLVPGPTLDEVLDEVAVGIPLHDSTQLRWLEVGLTALARLADAHHQLRDIKPENIGLTSDDPMTSEPVFLDHGVARRHGTQTLHYAGTPAYAAPEYLRRGAHDADTPNGSPSMAKVDIYSFGASLLDVFTGGQGFDMPPSADERSFLARPRLDNPRLAPDVTRLLRGALVKDPEQRPSARDLLDYLVAGSISTPAWDPYRPYGLASDEAATPLDDQAPAASGPGRAGGDSENETTELLELDAALAGRPRPVTVEGPHDAGAMPHADHPRVRLLPLTEDIAALERATPEPSLRRRWLERLAGVDPRYVTAVVDRTIYRILGLLLIVYGLYATGATTALVTMVTGRSDPLMIIVGILVGITVAVVVISLDRSIVATSSANLDDLDDPAGDDQPFKKKKKPYSMWVRVAFAVLFALFVGEAANLMVFQKDIEAHMSAGAVDSLAERREAIVTEHDSERQIQLDTIANAETAIADYRTDIEQAVARAEGERDGTFGTGASGCGEQCMTHLAQANSLIAGQGAFEEQQRSVIDAARAQIVAIDADIEAAVADAEVELALDTGLIAREDALWSMLTSDRSMLVKYLVLTALFLMLELAAVIIKLSTRGNNYERDLARALRHQERVARLRNRAARNLAERRARENDKLLADADRRYYDASSRSRRREA